MKTQKESGKFSSKLGFILASVGSAVGMGNIWMFPYRVGQYGGAAFLLLYFFFVALFGIVGLSGEFALGRLTGTGPVGSYRYVMQKRGKKGGSFLGGIALFASFGIALGYAVIVGWVLRFLTGSVTGDLFRTESLEYFKEITGRFGSVPWHILIVAATVFILSFGILKGIERVSKFMMPAFFLLFLCLAIGVAFLPGAIEGYRYLLVPKWEYLTDPITWVMAMGQAFFSLSIIGSGMICYGSYLEKKEDIVKSSILTAVLDTCAALLGGFVIIPAVFAFGMDPTAGPPLMFLTMPKIFAKMPMGQLVSFLFFLSVLFAGITSLINMLEVCVEAIQTKFHLDRKITVGLIGMILLVIGFFLEEEQYLSNWMDIITIYIVPVGAVLGAIMIYWVTKQEELAKELNLGRNKELGKSFFFTAKYIYIFLALAVLTLSILLGGIG